MQKYTERDLCAHFDGHLPTCDKTQVFSVSTRCFPHSPSHSGPIQSLSPWMKLWGLHWRGILNASYRSCLFFSQSTDFMCKLVIRHQFPEIWWICQPWACTLLLFGLEARIHPAWCRVFQTSMPLHLGFDSGSESQVVSNRAIFISASCPKWDSLISEKHIK